MRDQISVYVAGGYDSYLTVREVVAALRSQGLAITCDWTQYVGGPRDAQALAEVAKDEMNGVLGADIVVALPGGRGTWCEIGGALMIKIPVLLLDHDDGERPVSFAALCRHRSLPRFEGGAVDPVALAAMVRAVLVREVIGA